MSITAGVQRGARTAPQGNASRIGAARPSHLVTTAGVGSVVDLPSMSVMVRGLDDWSSENAARIHEPRLLQRLQAVFGPEVERLQAAPHDPRSEDDPWTRVGVPVTPFPTWLRCPRCHRIGPSDGAQFELVHRYGRRPDLAKWVHAQCDKQRTTAVARRRPALPARFVVACQAGHLDDFPYGLFVHRGSAPCPGPKYTMRDSASTRGPNVFVRCACGQARNIIESAGSHGSAQLPVCRGRHPHLGTFDKCGRQLKLMVLGASNLWFSITASALHLPQEGAIRDVVLDNWDVLGPASTKDFVATLLAVVPALRPLLDQPLDDVWAAVETIRAAGGPEPQDVQPDLLSAEWDLLSHPTTDRQDRDFRAEPTPSPDGYDDVLQQVVLVKRLLEVKALLGFTRVDGPGSALKPINYVPPARRVRWLPAVENRGEGVFLELRENAVAGWVERVRGHERLEHLRAAGERWNRSRGLVTDESFQLERYVLLHTLSHLLLRQVALECGYSSSSIRERLYVGTPEAPTAGILLSTASSDSEGTLGGLVALGEEQYLGMLLSRAAEEGARCSSDPLCADHVPTSPSEARHAAACHACLFASETSCECNNAWLDRATVLSLPDLEGLAFLP